MIKIIRVIAMTVVMGRTLCEDLQGPNSKKKNIVLDTCVGIWRASAMLCQLKLSSRASKAPCTPDSIRLLA